ncbi:MAG: ATP-binding protein [Acidaminobacteraceae bacterium]
MSDCLFNLIELPILKLDTSSDDIVIIECNESYRVNFHIKYDLSGKKLNDVIIVQDLKWMECYSEFVSSDTEFQKIIFDENCYEISKLTHPDNFVYLIHSDKTEEYYLSDRLNRTQIIGKIGDWENNIQLNNQKWSEQMYELLGEEANSFTEDYNLFMKYIHPDDYERVKMVNEKSFEDGCEFSLEFRIIAKDGSIKWMFTRGNFIYDDFGNQKKVYGMMQDITDNKHLEMLLVEELDKSKAVSDYKSKFLANMSHEIRTPLSSILGMSKLLLNNNLDMLSVNYTNNILSSGNLLLELVNDILDLSKIESGKIELEKYAFDFIYLMNSLTNLFQGKLINANIDFKIDIDESIPRYLYGDSNKVRQILINIIGNAIKFTEKGYVKLNVKLRSKIDGNIDIGFEVIDTGVGMESDKIEFIFDDYKQDNSSISRKFGGTGLGLAISKHLINLMSGNVDVISEVSLGTTFLFNLHLNQSSRKEVEFEEDFFEPLFLKDSITVLVAEDDRVNQIYFKTFLKQTYNFDVCVVEDGLLALDEIKNKKYEIVFLDSSMPNLGGIETAKRIRKLEDDNKNICLVALTAEAFKGDEERFLNAGFDYYISKPITEDVFSKVMKNILKDKIKFPLREENNASKSVIKDGDTLEYKYLSMENILEKSDLLGSKYFLVMMEYAIEEYGEKYTTILDDLAQKDIEQIYYQLHSVQGTLLYFSTNQLTDLIQNIEVCIKNKEYDNIYEFLNEFLTIFPLLIDELSDFYNYKKSLE